MRESRDPGQVHAPVHKVLGAQPQQHRTVSPLRVFERNPKLCRLHKASRQKNEKKRQRRMRSNASVPHQYAPMSTVRKLCNPAHATHVRTFRGHFMSLTRFYRIFSPLTSEQAPIGASSVPPSFLKLASISRLHPSPAYLCHGTDSMVRWPQVKPQPLVGIA
jgi:hypothetical protein